MLSKFFNKVETQYRNIFAADRGNNLYNNIVEKSFVNYLRENNDILVSL